MKLTSLHLRLTVWLAATCTVLFVLTSCTKTADEAKELTGATPAAQRVPNSKPRCTDILETWGTKPADLTFTGCADASFGGSRTLDYLYKVDGAKAKPTEAMLMTNYAMQPLKFACCGWEPALNATGNRLGVKRDNNGYDYELSMGSGETLERDWNKIDHFTVTVSLYLDVI